MGSVSTAAADARERALKTLDRLPPFSPILNRLIATMAREDVSFAELAELIEKDTVIAGNVLRLVNSALYSFRGTVNSVRHAVAILGLNKLRNVGLSMSVSRMFLQVPGPAGWSASRFNLHSVATGLLADLLAGRVEVDYPEGAFVAGLLHDLGKLLIAVAMPSEYAAIRQAAQSKQRPWQDMEQELLGLSHAELSAEALRKWRLPEQICEAVLHHHSQPAENTLAWVVKEANQAANHLGHAILIIPPGTGQPPNGEVSPTLEQFAAEFGALKNFF